MQLPTYDVPHTARVYDYYLGGKSHYAIDRQAGDTVLGVWPGARAAARTNRQFMHRAVRFLSERGVRQFLDIGTGIPTEPNLHQVAQSVAPESRVVYVDKDQLVLTYSDALMRSTPEGRTVYVEADVATDHERILDEAFAVLDRGRPVALSLVALLHFVPDEQGAREVVAALVDALPSGSALVLSHGTHDFDASVMLRVEEIYRQGGMAAQSRNREEILRFFDGLELVDPGIVPPHLWRPDEETQREAVEGDLAALVSMWAAVGLKR
ncbi:SAM-dependent methyltransferase [Streptomyces triticirhizae]|uniref:SAM-dependent methyltransferase n=1 Tax=Streptomyces triticirhizae TaxID=2483353 RepID=A0A3M2KUT0_9ACTN|nr:SAM-dependent methyltransferase [Streptomyces triticirhizae]RMI29412.1 SAM-dependent methyltransferase [Streptomyces triticirhizae]